jgi:simple sugar transport system ATP-binding protein
LTDTTKRGGGEPSGGERQLPALELRGIEKRFGSVQAVDSLNLSFAPGEVHALLGENGAGKSTSMNIAAGFLAPDVGTISVQGEPIQFGTPRDAIAVGVGMVHQHFRLVEQFSVARNLALGATDVREIISPGELTERAARLSEQYGLEVEPTRPVWSLSVGEKQRVEILRTLSRGAQVVILDEPTAVLTPDESDRLCATLREMAAQGRTVVFISHKLNEVMSVADRVSVMRAGSLVATNEKSDCDIQMLGRLMFGDAAAASPKAERRRQPSERVALRIKDAVVKDDWGLEALRGVSLEVRGGELVGLVGVAGNGQRELEEAIAGLRNLSAGAVEVDGTELSNGRPSKRSKLAYIPEDRLGMGLVGSEPIWRNAILRRHRSREISRGPIIRNGAAKRFAADLAESVNLSTKDGGTLVQHLSGGNAQKLLAGRELFGNRAAVVAVNPTQGLDVQAAAAVRDALVDAVERDLGVLLISADLDEVLLLADRVLVLYEGRICGEFRRGQSDRDRIGMMMGGGARGEEGYA